MSQVLKQSDSQKWINGFFAIASIIFAFILAAFFRQLGEWFDLEAKYHYYNGFTQAVAVVLGASFFMYLRLNKIVVQYINEVYEELTKVVWSNKDETIKLTVGIIVGIAITSVILGFVDFVISELLGYLYKI